MDAKRTNNQGCQVNSAEHLDSITTQSVHVGMPRQKMLETLNVTVVIRRFIMWGVCVGEYPEQCVSCVGV